METMKMIVLKNREWWVVGGIGLWIAMNIAMVMLALTSSVK